MAERIVDLVGVTQGYGKVSVFEEVTFSADIGVTALLGPNGAGKTTLLNTIATVDQPRAGVVTICGHDVSTRSGARAARRRMGFLPQHFGFFPGFTVEEFVTYVCWLREFPSRRTAAAVKEAIDLVGLGSQRRSKLATLSGGMRQRCGVAQAIAGDPELIILDEPTVGLDPEQRLELREILRTRSESAVLLSTHLVEDVAASCDHVCVLKDGRFVFDGKVSALMKMGAEDGYGDSPIERAYLQALRGVGSLS